MTTSHSIETDLDDAFHAAVTLSRVAKYHHEFETLAADTAKAARWLADQHRRCELCEHYLGGACRQAGGRTVPAEVIPKGCPSFEYQYIPF